MHQVVIGPDGLIGSALVRQLVANGENIILVTRSGKSKIFQSKSGFLVSNVKGFLEELDQNSDFRKKTKVIYNCAIKYLSPNEGAGAEFQFTNFELPLKLLTLGNRHSLPVVLFDSYLSKSNEDTRHKLYLESKRRIRERATDPNNSNILIIQLEHVFGPLDNKQKFINQFFELMMNQESLGAKKFRVNFPENKLDFVYSEDMAKFLVQIFQDRIDFQATLLRKVGSNFVNIGNRTPTRIIDFLSLAAITLGRNPKEVLEEVNQDAPGFESCSDWAFSDFFPDFDTTKNDDAFRRMARSFYPASSYFGDNAIGQ